VRAPWGRRAVAGKEQAQMLMRNFYWLALVALALGLAVAACEASQSHVSDDDSSSDVDSDSDSDVDSDSDSDSDGDDCEPGELFCDGNDVYECTGPDNQSEFVETCPSPLVCINGMCVSDDECGEALANQSNVGCEYWAVDMHNTTPNQPYAIAVSNLDAATVHVVVESHTSSGWVVLDEADIESKQVQVFMLGETTQAGTYHLSNQAFRVTSDLPVVAYQFNPYSGLQPDDSDICTNDGSLLLATSGLDQYYYVLAYPSNAGSSSMNIIAIEDNTTISVTPANAMMAGGSIPALSAGVPYEITMQSADVVQLESSTDVSGTWVESDKKIAVFGGSSCAFVPDSVMYCDHIEHQMFPVTTWGQEFVAARTVIRSIYQDPENDYWRVIASEDGTSITTDPTVAGLDGVTMSAGQVIEVGVNYSYTVSATAPIMIGQFLTGHTATDVDFYDAGGDPAFALLPPYEQFMTEYVFLAPEKYMLDYVVITHSAGLGVNLDGNPVNSNPDCITAAFSADWEITRCLIADFTHTIDAAEGVGISVWGYGGRVSYGYTGGLDLETINPIIPE
jgi:hypothetical protein